MYGLFFMYFFGRVFRHLYLTKNQLVSIEKYLKYTLKTSIFRQKLDISINFPHAGASL